MKIVFTGVAQLAYFEKSRRDSQELEALDYRKKTRALKGKKTLLNVRKTTQKFRLENMSNHA